MLEHVRQMRSVQLESVDGAWEWLDPGEKPSDEAVQAALDALSPGDLPTNQKGKPNGHWVNALNKLVEAVREPDWNSILEKGPGRLCLSPNETLHSHEMPAALASKLGPLVQRAIHECVAALAARNRATRALLERFEAKLKDFPGNVPRAATELAKEWRTDRILRRLEALMAVIDARHTLLLSGTGDVIQPTDGVLGIGSGGNYAVAAARAGGGGGSDPRKNRPRYRPLDVL